MTRQRSHREQLFLTGQRKRDDRYAVCNRCGGNITWARTSTGGRMPLDAEPSPGGGWTLWETELEYGVTRYKPDGVQLVGEPGQWRRHAETCTGGAA